MKTWTAPTTPEANRYQGGAMTPDLRALLIRDANADYRDAYAMLVESQAAGDDEAVELWRAEIERIKDTLTILTMLRG